MAKISPNKRFMDECRLWGGKIKLGDATYADLMASAAGREKEAKRLQKEATRLRKQKTLQKDRKRKA